MELFLGGLGEIDSPSFLLNRRTRSFNEQRRSFKNKQKNNNKVGELKMQEAVPQSERDPCLREEYISPGCWQWQDVSGASLDASFTFTFLG